MATNGEAEDELRTREGKSVVEGDSGAADDQTSFRPDRRPTQVVSTLALRVLE